MRRLIADDGKFVASVSILGIVILVLVALIVLVIAPTARDGVVPALSVGVTAIAAYRPGSVPVALTPAPVFVADPEPAPTAFAQHE